MLRRICAIGIGTVAAIGVACDDDEFPGIEGQYRVAIVETRDTCDGEVDLFSTRFSIVEEGDGVVVDFAEAGTLDGVVDEEGIIQASGTFTTQVDVGGTPRAVIGEIQIQIAVRRNRVDTNGRIIYDGTFPGVSGTCVQEFGGAGERLGSVPALPTGP